MRMLESELGRCGGRIANPWSLVKSPEEFWGDLGTQGRRLLKELLEGTMEAWRDAWVEVEWHKPAAQRKTHRNGYYERKRWPTALGLLRDVRVPRCRDAGLTEQMFARLGDPREDLAGSAIDLLLAGVSTRRVGELLERIIDLPVSAGQVSKLAKRLDAEVRAFHTRPLADEYVYLIFDAIHLKGRGAPRLVRSGLRRTRKRIVLVAYGVTKAGIKELIDFQIADSENAADWQTFAAGLQRRGLVGRNLRLSTTDGNLGLIAAVTTVWPFVPRQRCWFHKMQNVANKLPKRAEQEVLAGLRKVYDAANRAAAERAFVRWAQRWKDLYEDAVRCVETDLDALLQVYQLPAAHRRMMRTTNGIERRMRELRRRTRSIGTFVNDDSIERIIYGLFAYWNQKDAARVCREFRKAKNVA